MNTISRRALCIIGIMVASAVLAAMYRPGYVRRRTMEAKLAAAEAERRELKGRHAQLEARVWKLEHDPVELEREARQQLGLVRPGEVIYKFPENPSLP